MMCVRRILVPAVAALAVAACERGRAPAPAGEEAPAAGEAEVVYERDLLFLGGEAEPVRALLIATSSVQRGALVNRRVAGWRMGGSDWESLIDLQWTSEVEAAPWKLVPHRPFRLLVDGEGVLEAIHLDDDTAPIRLEADAPIGTWSPSGDADLLLRRAVLRTEEGDRSGILLDAQLAPGAAGAIPRAVLTDGAALFAVLWGGGEASSAWVVNAGSERYWSGLAVDTAAAAGAGWSIAAAEGDLRIDLEPTGAPAGAVGLAPVTGFIEIGGLRRPVHGLLGGS
jgi:hypothetical protein